MFAGHKADDQFRSSGAGMSEPGLFANLKNSDQEMFELILDDLSAGFCRDSGGCDFGRSAIKDKCLAAANRVPSNGEVKALAAGVCLRPNSRLPGRSGKQRNLRAP
jgi:hypothetical protein